MFDSVERILILGCGLHEPFTMGRSDGCERLSAHSSAQSSGTLSCQWHLWQTGQDYGFFLSGWIVVLNYLVI